jgi:hypothetical protein
MSKIRLAGIAVVWLLQAGRAGAAVGAGDTSASSVGLHLVLLVGAMLCFFVCLRIYSLLKGGELSTGWQMFSISFLIMTLAEALNLSTALEFFVIQPEFVNVARVLALFFLLFGATRIKKSLS